MAIRDIAPPTPNPIVSGSPVPARVTTGTSVVCRFSGVFRGSVSFGSVGSGSHGVVSVCVVRGLVVTFLTVVVVFGLGIVG